MCQIANSSGGSNLEFRMYILATQTNRNLCSRVCAHVHGVFNDVYNAALYYPLKLILSNLFAKGESIPTIGLSTTNEHSLWMLERIRTFLVLHLVSGRLLKIYNDRTILSRVIARRCLRFEQLSIVAEVNESATRQ